MVQELHEKADITLFECVDVELALGIARLNGRNNSSLLSSQERATYKQRYESTAR